MLCGDGHAAYYFCDNVERNYSNNEIIDARAVLKLTIRRRQTHVFGDGKLVTVQKSLAANLSDITLLLKENIII